MAENVFQFTLDEYNSLNERLVKLRTEEMPKVIADIEEARSHGDLSENAEYDAARERQGKLAAEIEELTNQLNHADIINESLLDPSQVNIGSLVDIEVNGVGSKVELANDANMDFMADPPKISDLSPIGAAIKGKHIGETVETETLDGKKLEIIIVGVTRKGRRKA